jgi:predicted GNAT family acetyltransferase
MMEQDSHPKADLEIVDNPDSRRWEVREGDAVIAFAEYRNAPGRVTFTHTVVEPEYEGHGIGSRLAKALLDDAVARELRISPVCPFIRSYIDRHPAYAPSVDMSQPRQQG